VLVPVTFVLIPSSGALTWILARAGAPREFTEHLFYCWALESLVAIFVVSVLALIWAVAMPRWLERILEIAYRKLLWLFFASFVVLYASSAVGLVANFLAR
jgi:hypothetical protein